MDPADILKKYEKIVYLILIFLFAVIVAFSLAELVRILFVALFLHTPGLLVDKELLEIIGYFLLVLIAVEILSTISVYIRDNTIHVEAVIIVAIIAIARGVILFEPNSPSANALNMFGTAAIIIALCSGYYLLRKGGTSHT
jgi:uncharacterized membrane protein (DUF373 family)